MPGPLKCPRFALCIIFPFMCVGCGAGIGLDEAPSEETTSDRTTVTVTNVVDGDTFDISPRIDGIQDVRMIGIDTPEPYSEATPQPLSTEASDFTRDNLEGRGARLEFDAEKTDDYGRLLAYVYLDGEMFNERLLHKGYAQVATFPPNTRYLSRFEAAQDEARSAWRGIWSLPPDESCLLRDRGNGIGGGC